jgi:hypothetical protein
VWQALREELHPLGLEIVTVGMDAMGANGCRRSIEAASPTHPSLIDTHHVMAELFGVIQIPNGVWINEDGIIVRPAETAPAPPAPAVEQPATTEQPSTTEQPAAEVPAPQDLPARLVDMMAEAAGIETQPEAYHAALRDWVAKGVHSKYALSPAQVIARSRPRSADMALGQAHFELASELEVRGHHGAAIEYFKQAHRLVPDNWTYRRQAWSLETANGGPVARRWQGPGSENPDDWPYAGDWLTDIREVGASNYYEPFVP